MGEFNYNPAVCSFKGWLLLLTRRRIADHFRKRQREPSADTMADDQTLGEVMEDLTDETALPSEASWDQAWESNLLDAAIERVKQQVSPLQFQIFDWSF